MKIVRWMTLLAAAAAVAGCNSKNGPAEVPKNPVPMEKPGPGANPGGGPKGAPEGAQPGQAAQPLPK